MPLALTNGITTTTNLCTFPSGRQLPAAESARKEGLAAL